MKKILLILVALILVIIFFRFKQGNNLPKVLLTSPSGQKIEFSAEIADTPELQSQGLMHRKELSENHSMLFVFEKQKIQHFWMKNTLIPLDMIFADENGKIVKIVSAEPCQKDPCQNYSSEKPAKYVLEINRGTADKYDIKDGWYIITEGI